MKDVWFVVGKCTGSVVKNNAIFSHVIEDIRETQSQQQYELYLVVSPDIR